MEVDRVAVTRHLRIIAADVAETVAWLAGPASAAVNGNVVRVCGQQLLGA